MPVAVPSKPICIGSSSSTWRPTCQLARDEDWDGHAVPAYAEREFRRYLECGILAVRFRPGASAGQCGHDFLLACSVQGARRLSVLHAPGAWRRPPRISGRPGLPRRCRCASGCARLPKRLRYFLQREPRALGAVLRRLPARGRDPAAAKQSGEPRHRRRLGAVSFVHHFGASLNAPHPLPLRHPRRCIRALRRRRGPIPLPAAAPRTRSDVAALAERLRRRVLRGFARRASARRRTTPSDMGSPGRTTAASRSMPRCASARTTGPGASGGCATARARRSPSSGIEQGDERRRSSTIYPSPGAMDRPAVSLSPLELIDRLAALIPPPRLHRHRYHGVLAPPRAAARCRHRRRARRGEPQRAAATRARFATRRRSKLPLPGALPVGHAAGAPVRVPAARLSPRWSREAHDRLHRRGRPGAADSHPYRRAGRAAAYRPGTRPARVG
ncbi:MAG: transposase [Chromatiales bacterium]|nr:transposase [Chromatiales bacterium]